MQGDSPHVNYEIEKRVSFEENAEVIRESSESGKQQPLIKRDEKENLSEE